MSRKGPAHARKMLTTRLAEDKWLVAFTGGTSPILNSHETVADVEAVSGVSEFTEVGRAKAAGSSAPDWIVSTVTSNGVTTTRARNDAAIAWPTENSTGSSVYITAVAMVDNGDDGDGTPIGSDASASSDDSRIVWFVNLSSPGFEVPATRIPQVPIGASDFSTGFVIQEA